MKSIIAYINEKLIVNKNTRAKNIENKNTRIKNIDYKYDPELELDIPSVHLEYIRVLIVLAQGKAVKKEHLKELYDQLKPEKDKMLIDFYDNLIKYINNHPDLNVTLKDNDFDEIYDILKLLPENELEKYVEKKNK